MFAGNAACASNPGGSTGGLGFDRLSNALRLAGATVRTGGSVEQPFLSVPGRILGVNGEDVQVFEYASASAARSDAGRVSPDGRSVGTTQISWLAPPHFFHRDRVIALYVGSTANIVSALSAALDPQFAGPTP